MAEALKAGPQNSFERASLARSLDCLVALMARASSLVASVEAEFSSAAMRAASWSFESSSTNVITPLPPLRSVALAVDRMNRSARNRWRARAFLERHEHVRVARQQR